MNSKIISLASIMIGALILQGCGGDSKGGFTQTGIKEVGPSNPHLLVKVTNNDPALFESANVIADFEDVAYMKNPANGWTVTGVFAELSDWRGVTIREASARVGAAAVSTCEIGGKDCDSNIGSILTPAFKITSDYINFLMTGGNTKVGVEVRLAGTDTVLLSYKPNSCSKPHITDNDDWFHFDVRALKNQNVQLYIFDNETGGCGFISFDHFYQSNEKIGTEAASAGEPISGDGVTLPDDGISNIVGTFDDAQKMVRSAEFEGEGWSATGDFANPQTAGAWMGASISADAAKIGDRSFSSCSTLSAGCAALTGSIVSPEFVVTQDYIYFLATGGSDTNSDAGIRILNSSTNEVLATYTPKSCAKGYITSNADWAKFDVSAIHGQKVKVEIFDHSTKPCGYIAVDHVYQSSRVSFQDSNHSVVTPVVAGVANIPEEFRAQNVSLAVDAFVEGAIIGNFDSPAKMLADGWSVTGDFANAADDSAWMGTTRFDNSAKIGSRAVSTCEMNGNAKGCDASTGTVTSPITTVKQDYLYFLMGGGNGANPVGMRVLDSVGNILHTYLADTCGPAFIDGDNDWSALDWSAIKHAHVRVQMFDEEAGGCGFLSFDHLYQSAIKPADAAFTSPVKSAGVVTLNDQQIATLGFNADLPYADSANNVIGNFDDAIETINSGWIGTGVFANPTSADTWQGTTRFDDAARIGKHSVSTCEINNNAAGCDAPTGTLTSPAYKVTAEQSTLVFMMAGGNGTAAVGIRVLSAADNTELAKFTPNSCGPSFINGNDDWHELDLSAYVGQMIKVEIFDNEAAGCGFLSFDHVHFSAKSPIVPSYVKYPPTNNLQGVTLASDGFDQVIGRFDDALQTIADGWIATGDFANPAGATAWVGVAKNVRVGSGAVSTCEMNGNAKGCDGSTGTLTSPDFVVDAARPYLNILMSGGNDAGNNNVGFKVLDSSNTTLYSYTPHSCGAASIAGDQHWVSLNLTAQVGASVHVEIFDNESSGCGFISFDHLYMGSAPAQLP